MRGNQKKNKRVQEIYDGINQINRSRKINSILNGSKYIEVDYKSFSIGGDIYDTDLGKKYESLPRRLKRHFFYNFKKLYL